MSFNNYYALQTVETDENTGRIYLSAGNEDNESQTIYDDVEVCSNYGFISVPAIPTNNKNAVPTILKTDTMEICIAVHDERSQVIAKDLKDGESVVYSMKDGAIKVNLKCLQETMVITVNGLSIVVDKDKIVVGEGSDKVVRKSDLDAMRSEINDLITKLKLHTHPETGTTTSASADLTAVQPISSQTCSSKLLVP